jgi:hypothetical protein
MKNVKFGLLLERKNFHIQHEYVTPATKPQRREGRRGELVEFIGLTEGDVFLFDAVSRILNNREKISKKYG